MCLPPPVTFFLPMLDKDTPLLSPLTTHNFYFIFFRSYPIIHVYPLLFPSRPTAEVNPRRKLIAPHIIRLVWSLWSRNADNRSGRCLILQFEASARIYTLPLNMPKLAICEHPQRRCYHRQPRVILSRIMNNGCARTWDLKLLYCTWVGGHYLPN